MLLVLIIIAVLVLFTALEAMLVAFGSAALARKRVVVCFILLHVVLKKYSSKVNADPHETAPPGCAPVT